MIGRKTIIGLTVLCALLVSAFAAQAASEAGTTGYTCVSVATPGAEGTKGFKDAHCKEATENKKTPRLQNAATGPAAGIEGTLTIKANDTLLSVTA